MKAYSAAALCLLCALMLPDSVSAPSPGPGVVLEALRDELNRAMPVLKTQKNPAYFISYHVSDLETVAIEANLGALRSNTANRGRYLDIEVRIGDYGFDNTHQIRGAGRFPGSRSGPAWI